MSKIVKFVVTAHTTNDDKDKGNGVTVAITRKSDLIVHYGPVHQDLKFGDGSENGWELTPSVTFDEADGANSVLSVTMTGNDGNWNSAFSLTGIRENGGAVVLLPKSGSVHFESGDNNTHQFQLQ